MYYRTVVASALIRLLRLVTPAQAQRCACILAISKIANYYNRDSTCMTEVHTFCKNYAKPNFICMRLKYLIFINKTTNV